MPNVSRTELASELGLTTARISQLIELGLPVRPDKLIDLDVAVAWVGSNIKPRSKIGPDRPEGFYDARTRKEIALANLREHELAIKRGEYILKEDDRMAWGAVNSRFRSRMLAVPSRAAPLLMAEATIEGMRSILERFIHEGLTELSETPICAMDNARSRDRAGSAGGSSTDSEDQ